MNFHMNESLSYLNGFAFKQISFFCCNFPSPYFTCQRFPFLLQMLWLCVLGHDTCWFSYSIFFWGAFKYIPQNYEHVLGWVGFGCKKRTLLWILSPQKPKINSRNVFVKTFTLRKCLITNHVMPQKFLFL